MALQSALYGITFSIRILILYGTSLRSITIDTFVSSLGVRDYIHVVDLALGHVAALRRIQENCGCKVSTP